MRESQHTPWGHTPCVPCGGWRGAVPPLTPTSPTARHESSMRGRVKGSRQRGGACRVARQGAMPERGRRNSLGKTKLVLGASKWQGMGVVRWPMRNEPRHRRETGHGQRDRPEAGEASSNRHDSGFGGRVSGVQHRMERGSSSHCAGPHLRGHGRTGIRRHCRG